MINQVDLSLAVTIAVFLIICVFIIAWFIKQFKRDNNE